MLSLTVRLANRRVIVAGGGSVVIGAVASLVHERAEVTVVSPAAAASIEDLATRGVIDWQRRDLVPDDLAGTHLLVVSADDAETDAAAVQMAESAGVWAVGPADLEGRAGSGRDADSHDDRNHLEPGSVTLVGGGPGDVGLLTVEGLRAVRGADVVVVDRLAPVEVLDGLSCGVEVVDVAKIPRGRSACQDDINALLVDRARAGRRVVRLKGGDGFVLGRGMEEARACADAGVPVRVLPGVSSAVAVPALAGVPVTHRGLAQGFSVVSGHVPPDDPRSDIDWAALSRSGTTLVVLMGVATLQSIAVALVGGGADLGTPVACVVDGALPSQLVLTSTLGRVAAEGPPPGLRPPAVTVIGAVAAFAGPVPT